MKRSTLIQKWQDQLGTVSMKTAEETETYLRGEDEDRWDGGRKAEIVVIREFLADLKKLR